MTSSLNHTPVLLAECIDGLAIKPEGIYLDATFGRGGHSQSILTQLGQQGRLLVMDKDPQAIQVAQALQAKDDRVTFYHGSFSEMIEFCEQAGVTGKLSGILMDLGISSPQIDDPNRGFSFQQDGPLDMRMDTTKGQTAAEWLQTSDEAEITRVLKVYGEERFGKRIARAIIQQREIAPLKTTHELAALVKQAVPVIDKHKHPATRTFQAIRIVINEELDALEETLKKALSVLAPEGRLAIISFHSLEDRMVKRFFQKEAKGDEYPRDFPITQAELSPSLKVVGKAIKPSQNEVARNVRSRSAVLRIAEKLAS